MSDLEFTNGKAYLDYCYLCNESKEAIKYSQRNTNNPIFCGAVDYFGECIWESERHVFVVSEEAYKADLAAERSWFNANGVELDENNNIKNPELLGK